MTLIKPFFLALLLTVSLFAASILSYHTIGEMVDTMDTQIELSRTAADLEHWEETEAALQNAHQIWKNHDSYLRITAADDHLDRSEALFTQAFVYIREKNAASYQLCILALSGELQCLKNEQAFTPGNIF